MILESPLCTVIEDEVFVFPTSFAQQRLWFLDQLAPGTCFYNVPLTLRFIGTLDFTALTESFNEIVRRHEALRTTFAWINGQPVQVIAPHLSLSLPLTDLQDLPLPERNEELQRLLSEAAQRSFDLSQGPLLRLMVIQLSQTERVLLLNFHHIVFDEWSSGLLIQELGALYTAFTQGQPSPLKELPIQYADFAHWQREWLQGKVLSAQLAYWRRQLRDVSFLDLPSDRPRSSLQRYRGTTQQLEISQELTQTLESLSQQSGATLFMTLLAAFQTLLYRYTGQTDVAVGSPIANRNRSELEGLIGFFVNSLVLRTDLSGDPTFRELLERVREVALAAYAHQDVPFEKLVEELHPERHLGCNPLFQVVFALQNAPMTQLELPGLTLRSSNFETKTTRFDLELYLWECSEDFRSLWGDGWNHSVGLRGVLVYNTDLFDQASILRLLESFQTLLAGLAANPDQRLSEVPVLTASQQQQLLIEWNQTQRDYPHHQCIHQVFEAQVQRSPDAIALQFGDNQFTYRELNNGSNQLAHYLQTLGVSAGSRVGICMERAEMVAGLLGILKAGGAYVPLDPAYPVERLRWMMQDAGISVLLTQHQWSAQFEETGLTLVCLDRDWESIAQTSENNPATQTSVDDVAYVIYTSGSTGTPKGAAVPHRAVNRLVCNPNYIQWEPGDRVAQVSNISFDAATFEIWGALLNGAQLVGIDRDVFLSPLAFADQMQQHQVSVLFLTTALFNQMAQEIPSTFCSLRYLLFGGEAVDPQRVRTVLMQGAPQHLLHMYGPTESTTFASWYGVKQVDEKDSSIPIGRPIANTQIYLLDPYLNPVPIGVRGELYIGGDGLAQGYLNRPDLTTERFIPNPFIPGRLYKTGDLARYRADGTIEFLGRMDDQVKLRGFRIELGEIEAVLSQHPAVQTAIALLHEVIPDQPRSPGKCLDKRPDKRLIAYIVSSQKPVPTSSDLRRFLKSKLPSYMIPAAFVVLDALPLTANGKVDRRALLAIAPTTERVSLPHAPQTAIEQTLVTLWQQILGQEQIGIYDNFFELGGHSLLATQLMSRVRDAFQLEVPLRSLFETPTIAGLAASIETINWAAQGDQRVDATELIAFRREEVEF